MDGFFIGHFLWRDGWIFLVMSLWMDGWIFHWPFFMDGWMDFLLAMFLWMDGCIFHGWMDGPIEETPATFFSCLPHFSRHYILTNFSLTGF